MMAKNQSHPRRSAWSHGRLLWLLVLALPLLNGCGFMPAWSRLESTEVTPVAVVEMQTAVATAPPVAEPAQPVVAATAQAAVAEPLFVWQGALEDGSCGQVTVGAEGVGGISLCNDTAQMNAWLPIHQSEWALIQAHFGSLSYQWGDETLALHGAGTVEDEVWAEAIGVWARFVYQEALAGRSSSAGRTALAWQHEDVPGQEGDEPALCGRLLIMRYGYAYALAEPCEGGAAADPLAEGWLTTEEMSQFVTWLRAFEPVYAGASYLDGQGDGAAGDEDVAALAEWTHAVFTRMTQ